MKVKIEKPDLIPIGPMTNTTDISKPVLVYFRGASEGQMSQINELSKKRGSVLREKRLDLRLTQKQVAERSGIPYQSYQKFESGERNIMTCSFQIACRVVEALQMDITKFYHGEYGLKITEKEDSNTYAT